MSLSVLVMSDKAVKKGKDKLFDCLFGKGFKRVYRIGLADAIAQYRETVDDGWDILIVDRDGGEEIIAQLLDVSGEGIILFIDSWFPSLKTTSYGFGLPRNGEMLKAALEKIVQSQKISTEAGGRSV